VVFLIGKMSLETKENMASFQGEKKKEREKKKKIKVIFKKISPFFFNLNPFFCFSIHLFSFLSFFPSFF